MTTTHSAHRANRRSPAGGRQGTAVPDVAGELRRLSDRDIWLIELLHEHHVLTTDQITALGFDNIKTTRNRLGELAERGVLNKFRRNVRPGSEQYRWCLGWVGAAYIAARDDQPTPKHATIADKTNRLAASPRLYHQLGVNEFFVQLGAHARHTPGARLSRWWSEKRCRDICGDLVRPDGRGTWTEDDTTVDFWLEYDRATEPTRRLLERLDAYHNLHQAADLDLAVLIRLQTARHETELHKRLTDHPAITSGDLLVATMHGEPDTNPAGPVWRPARHPQRIRLAHLALLHPSWNGGR